MVPPWIYWSRGHRFKPARWHVLRILLKNSQSVVYERVMTKKSYSILNWIQCKFGRMTGINSNERIVLGIKKYTRMFKRVNLNNLHWMPCTSIFSSRFSSGFNKLDNSCIIPGTKNTQCYLTYLLPKYNLFITKSVFCNFTNFQKNSKTMSLEQTCKP